MFYRRVANWMIGLSLILLTCSPVRAALLVAPDQIPSDALLVISVADTQGLWENLKQSPLYGSVKNLLNLPSIQSDPGFQKMLSDVKAAEKSLGVPLDPDSLFTKVLTGVDFALTVRSEATEEPDLLVILKFKDPKLAGAVMKEMENAANKTQAPQAPSATPGAAALPKATYQTIAGQQVLVVPGEGLWATHKNDLLILASTAAMMNKSLSTNAATGIEKSQFIRDGLTALGNPTRTHTFLYLDYAGILKAMSASKPELQASLKSVQDMLNIKFLGVATVSPDHISAQTYSPSAPNDTFVAELAQRYPASEMQVVRFIPSASMLAATLNNFDGPLYFDKIINQFADMSTAMAPPDSSGASPKDQFRQQVDTYLKEFEAQFGFKLKDDLLAAVGPEASFNLENFAFNPLVGPIPSIDLSLCLQVRDKAKLDLVLGRLERYLTNKLPAMMGGGMQDQGGQKPTFPMKEFVVDNAKGKVLVLPQMPTYAFGWVLVDNYVVVGTTENALKHAAQAYSGKMVSMVSSPQYGKIKQYLPQKANSQAMFGVRTVAEFVNNMIMSFSPQSVQGDQGAVFNAIMDIVKTVETAYLTSVTNTKGQTLGYAVLGFAKEAPPAPAGPSVPPADQKPTDQKPATQ